jgi:hypothetical protein
MFFSAMDLDRWTGITVRTAQILDIRQTPSKLLVQAPDQNCTCWSSAQQMRATESLPRLGIKTGSPASRHRISAAAGEAAPRMFKVAFRTAEVFVDANSHSANLIARRGLEEGERQAFAR